jgi:hypothetical protein
MESGTNDDAPKSGGYAAERLLEAWLLKHGFRDVDRRRGATGLTVVERGGELKRVSQKRDYFGCIDVSATSDDLLWLIQVTTKAGLSKRRGKVAAIRWPLRPILAGHLRVSIFEHLVERVAGGRLAHTWKVEDYKPSLIRAGDDDWAFHEDHYRWSFVRAGSYEFRESELVRDPPPPLDESIVAEARRIADLPKEEREAAIAAAAAERKARRKAERGAKK